MLGRRMRVSVPVTVLVFMLVSCVGRSSGEVTGLGDAVAHVALVFGLDVDPELVLDACDSLDPRTARATDKQQEQLVWFWLRETHARL